MKTLRVTADAIGCPRILSLVLTLDGLSPLGPLLGPPNVSPHHTSPPCRTPPFLLSFRLKVLTVNGAQFRSSLHVRSCCVSSAFLPSLPPSLPFFLPPHLSPSWKIGMVLALLICRTCFKDQMVYICESTLQIHAWLSHTPFPLAVVASCQDCLTSGYN